MRALAIIRHSGAMIAGAVVLLAAVTGSEATLDLEAYREAARSGRAGQVSGRAYEERRRPDLPDRHVQDVTVTILPRPETLARRLDEVKRGARDSHEAFRTAVPRLLEAQQQHERAVRAAGGSDLVFTVAVGPDGTFVVPSVPAGAWLLIARQQALIPRTGNQITKSDREMYRVTPAPEAYQSVRLWVRELAVTDRVAEVVELTDRNVWFSGLVAVRPGATRP